MRGFGKICIVLGVVFIGIQFVPVDRANPPVQSDFAGPKPVKQILKQSCYDCHSNETKWPWYSYVAPVSWLVAHDVKEGRSHLNFSKWQAIRDQQDTKEEIVEEVVEGEMPMPIYLVMHTDARLKQEAITTLKSWAGVAAGYDGHHQEGEESYDR